MLVRVLIWIGVLFLLGALFVYLFGKMGIHIGKLPLDFSWNVGLKNKGKLSVFFPLGTCLLLSVLFSLCSYLFLKFKK